MHYDMIANDIYGPGVLGESLTIHQLVTLVARETTLTANQIEERLLAVINDMTENYEPKEDE